jgi:hypothetical protein
LTSSTNIVYFSTLEEWQVAPRVSSIHIPTRIVVLVKRRVLLPDITRDDPLETADTVWEEDDTIPRVIP